MVTAQLHLPTHDLFWANLKVQLHLPALDLLIFWSRLEPWTRRAQRSSFNTLDNWGHKITTQLKKRKDSKKENVKGHDPGHKQWWWYRQLKQTNKSANRQVSNLFFDVQSTRTVILARANGNNNNNKNSFNKKMLITISADGHFRL